MKIPLHHFEHLIDEQILQRGLSYFRSGAIETVDEIAHGEYEAVVQGSENYTVRCKIAGGVMIEFYCTCPYDQGPVCKHVVALMLYLQRDVLELEQKTKRGKPTKKNSGGQDGTKKKTPTVQEQVGELLNRIPTQSLKEYVSELALNDVYFRQRFLSDFAYMSVLESKDYYAKQVKSILKKGSDRHGFIDWRAASGVGMDVCQLLGRAEKHLKSGNIQSAVFICCAVLEEMTRALQFADDSHADIGDNIQMAFDMLATIAAVVLPDDIRSGFYAYTLDAYRSGVFKGWDWHLGILELAADLQVDDDEAGNIIELLDGPHSSEYQLQRAQGIKARLLEEIHGKEAAIEYLESHLDNAHFRKLLVDRAIENKDYARAMSLAEEGVAKDLKDKPGLAVTWYKYLFDISALQKDNDGIIKYAKTLVIENLERQKHYEILKVHVPLKQWDGFLETLVADIQEKRRWPDVHDVAWIYINEKRWDKLREVIVKQFREQHISLETLKEYAGFLVSDYLDDVAEIYRQGILGEATRTTDRKHYQRLCRHIRIMKKLGAKDQAANVIKSLQELYPKRIALMEELRMI